MKKSKGGLLVKEDKVSSNDKGDAASGSKEAVEQIVEGEEGSAQSAPPSENCANATRSGSILIGKEVADKSSESSDAVAVEEKAKQEKEQIDDQSAGLETKVIVGEESEENKEPLVSQSNDTLEEAKNKTGIQDETLNSSKFEEDGSIENDLNEILRSDIKEEIEILFDGQHGEDNLKDSSDETDVSDSGKKAMIKAESVLRLEELEPTKGESIVDESGSNEESVKVATGEKPSYVDASGFRRR